MSRSALAFAPAAHRGKQKPDDKARTDARRELQRIEAREIEDGIADTVARALARGDAVTDVVQTRDRYKPRQKLDGLGWLHHRGAITRPQLDAGRKFESLYVILYSGDVRSCLSAMEVRQQTQRLTHTEAKVYAREKLAEVDRALGCHPGMVFALHEVCGEGKRPAEAELNRRGYERLEANLDCALSILVKHWGL
jgi:hypothetical protein